MLYLSHLRLPFLSRFLKPGSAPVSIRQPVQKRDDLSMAPLYQVVCSRSMRHTFLDALMKGMDQLVYQDHLFPWVPGMPVLLYIPLKCRFRPRPDQVLVPPTVVILPVCRLPGTSLHGARYDILFRMSPPDLKNLPATRTSDPRMADEQNAFAAGVKSGPHFVDQFLVHDALSVLLVQLPDLGLAHLSRPAYSFVLTHHPSPAISTSHSKRPLLDRSSNEQSAPFQEKLLRGLSLDHSLPYAIQAPAQ